MRKLLPLALVVPLALTLAACGSSGSTSAPGTSAAATSGGAVTSSSATVNNAGATKLPSGTVGVLEIQGASEVISREAQDIKTADDAVGWKTVITDGKGDPATLSQGMTSFIAQKVDAILVLAVDSAAIAPQITQAKAAGIPVIASAFSVNDPTNLYTAQFAPSNDAFAQAEATYLKQKYPNGASYVEVNVPGVFAAYGLLQATAPILKSDGFTLLGNADANATNIVNTMTSATTTVIDAHPQASFLLSCCDFTPPLQVAALKAAGKPNVFVVGRYDNLSSLAVVRAGAPVSLTSVNLDTGSLLALDAIFAKKASGTAIPTDNPQSDYTFKTVDKTSLPATGQFVFPPATQTATFTKKWNDEYAK